MQKCKLGRGFLTGTLDEKTTFDSSDFRNGLPRFTAENRNANRTLVDRMAEIARRTQSTLAQVTVLGARYPEQLENMSGR